MFVLGPEEIWSLAVTSVTDDAPWLTVTPSSGTAPLRLAATVDRTGLADGDYSATITITTDAGEGDQTATVDVRVSVGGPTLGNVGTVYVLVADAGTFDTVDQAITSAAQGHACTTPVTARTSTSSSPAPTGTTTGSSATRERRAGSIPTG